MVSQLAGQQEFCQLRWDWEVEIPQLKTSVFVLPETITKTSTDITTHYSAAEIKELMDAAERIVDRGVAQTPTLTVISRNRENVGKVSELKKG